jgi:predicted nucleic acid-binding protein
LNARVLAPTLFRYEVVSALRKRVYRNMLTLDEAMILRENLLRHPIEFLVSDDLLHRAYELATHLNRPTAYDAQYLAVAEQFDCEFWTADERLFNAVTAQLPYVKWIGNFPLPQE